MPSTPSPVAESGFAAASSCAGERPLLLNRTDLQHPGAPDGVEAPDATSAAASTVRSSRRHEARAQSGGMHGCRSLGGRRRRRDRARGWHRRVVPAPRHEDADRTAGEGVQGLTDPVRLGGLPPRPRLGVDDRPRNSQRRSHRRAERRSSVRPADPSHERNGRLHRTRWTSRLGPVEFGTTRQQA